MANLIVSPSDFTNAAWGPIGGFNTIPNGDFDPNRILDADVVQDTNNTGVSTTSQHVVIAAPHQPVIVALVVKKTSGATTFPCIDLRLNTLGNLVGAVILNTDTGVATPRTGFAPSGFQVIEWNPDYWLVWLYVINLSNFTDAYWVGSPAFNNDGLGDVVVAAEGNSTWWLADMETGFTFPSIAIPQAAFSLGVGGGLSVSFLDATTPVPFAGGWGTGWFWDFGDSNNSTAQNPTHVYAAAGTYTVMLTVTNTYGSTSTSQSVTVSAGTAAFSFSPPSPIAGITSVAFTDSSTFPSTLRDTAFLFWKLDEGASATTALDATGNGNTGAGGGTYTSGVTGEFGNAWTLASGASIAGPTPANQTTPFPFSTAFWMKTTQVPGVAAYVVCRRNTAFDSTWWAALQPGGTIWFQVENASSVLFSAKSTTVVNDNTWHHVALTYSGGQMQLFVDGVLQQHVTNATNQQYGDGQPFFVGFDQRDSTFFYVGSLDEIGYWDRVLTPAEIALLIVSADPAKSWAWDFGDSNTSTLENPSHVYAAAGSYTASLTIGLDGGSSAPVTHIVPVSAGGPPVAAFSFSPSTIYVPTTVNFTDLSTNTPTSWLWDFGDGHTSTLQNPSHVYAAAGSYTVTLTATNGSGSNSIPHTVTVLGAPVAAFSSTSPPIYIPTTVNFTDASTNTPTSWFWDFGDGNHSTLQNPSHVYAAGGVYTVSLTATNPSGSSSPVTHPVTVIGVPVANFTDVPTGLSVAFTDTSTNGPTSWAWDFGDSSTSTLQNPSHAYSASGTYHVTLTATNPSGSSSPHAVDITVALVPVVDFIFSVTGFLASFTDESTNTPTSWLWDFGDGNTSTLQNPSHVYTSDGIYTVMLTASNIAGSGSRAYSLVIGSPPTPSASRFINAAPFNTPSHPFNEDPPLGSAGTARQILLPATPSSSLPPPNRPVIRRTFGANADDYAEQTPPSTVDTAQPVRSVSIYGCFTAVRAAAVLHQYDIGFWGDSGIIAMVAAATTPDPTQDQLVQMYQDFLLLSYLPDSMVPTQAQFNDLATPSKQAAVLTANLPLMGITTDPTSANDATVVDEANTVPSTLPTPAPYAASISQFCDGSQIFSPTTLVGGA